MLLSGIHIHFLSDPEVAKHILNPFQKCLDEFCHTFLWKAWKCRSSQSEKKTDSVVISWKILHYQRWPPKVQFHCRQKWCICYSKSFLVNESQVISGINWCMILFVCLSDNYFISFYFILGWCWCCCKGSQGGL